MGREISGMCQVTPVELHLRVLNWFRSPILSYLTQFSLKLRTGAMSLASNGPTS